MRAPRKWKPCEVPSHPHGLKYPRLYACGWKCDKHSPWAVAGRLEPQPGPGLPEGAWTSLSPLGTSGLIDLRAIASGKRRSSPHTYRAAQAAVRPAQAEADLRVDLGHWDEKHRRWLRYPTADFSCPNCDFTDSASGDAVSRFAATIRDLHKRDCMRQQSSTRTQGAQTPCYVDMPGAEQFHYLLTDADEVTSR